MRARKRGRGGAGALLAVLVLSLCFLLTGGQTVTTTTISVYPPNPIEGGNVSLIPKVVPAKTNSCRWFRGAEATANTIFIYYFYPSPTPTPGTNYTGRETMDSTCSLHITNLAGNYSGTYMFSLEIIGGIIEGKVELLVSEPVSDISITSTPSTIVEDALVTLNCTAAKGTEVSYFWSKGDQVLESDDRVYLSDDNRNITFNTTVREDSGNYTCYANNSFSNSSSTYILNVYYGPDPVVIEPRQQLYLADTSLNLSCWADSDPPATYTWYFNNDSLPIGNGSLFVIPVLSMNNSGTYHCNASNADTGHSSDGSVQIVVLEPVSDISITSTPSTIVEDALVTLNCTAAKGTEVSYFWSKGDQVLESDDRVYLSDDNRNITFNTTVREDSGNYTCYANNSFSNSSSTYILNVYYGPSDVFISPNTTYYKTGSSLNLSCTAVSNPPANYTWRFNNETHDGSNWEIDILTVSHSGKYICEAFNEETGLNQSHFLEIKVLEPVSDISITSTPSKVVEDALVTLNCTAAKGTEVSYFWFKGDQVLESDDRVYLSDDNRNITFNTTVREDSGNYTCYANNSLSNSSSTYYLDVYYGPDIPVILPKTPYYAAGTTLRLSCTAASNPLANYTWHFGNGSVSSGSTLTFNLILNDTGFYNCTASNDETDKSSTQSQKVTVVEHLDPPVLTPDSYLPLEKENVTLKCNTSSSAAVSWQKDGKDELPGNAALSENNRTLTLSGFTQKDNGTYTCVASNPRFTAPSNPSVLSMAYGPNNVKINSTRNLTVGLDSTVSLVCSADSNPEAQFRWFVNNTAVTVTKATYNIASVTWGNAGEYRCQANNSRTNLTGTYTVTIIVQVEKPDNPDNPGGLSGGAIAGIVIGCLAAVILIAGLVYYICTKTSVGPGRH
ncbi:carcinoembryonic antigen-related cell adhesion molecule 5 isoform X3 [Anolis carolinensis]|uniref:carcinoembryonic antigen-related cell adhesion molecule 5 isoform X3 n=1 Tax=Anolis carolinensis TaxID=28377 RepID=UPI002F2B187C